MNVRVRSYNPIDASVGLRLRQRRKECKMTQMELAEKLKISFQQVQKYEKGIIRVGASRLADIANCLNVPVSYFFGPDQVRESEISHSAFELVAAMKKPDVLELNRAFVTIANPAHRCALIKLIDAIANAAPGYS